MRAPHARSGSRSATRFAGSDRDRRIPGVPVLHDEKEAPLPNALYTIGHSTQTLDALAAALRLAGIVVLVDVRVLPRSRRHPQFNRAALEAGLSAHGIRYAWAGEAFGGFRKPRPGSPHLALASPAFRGFADHMETAAFQKALGALLERAGRERVAIMCAEREPADCHRSLIADAALARGVRVIHLGVAGGEREARMRDSARAVGGTLIYDGGQARFPDAD